MNDKQIICHLLYNTLIQFRDQGNESGDKKLYMLSHWLHNVPLKLIQAKTDQDYAEILQGLQANCKASGFGKWVEQTAQYWPDFDFKKTDWFASDEED